MYVLIIIFTRVHILKAPPTDALHVALVCLLPVLLLLLEVLLLLLLLQQLLLPGYCTTDYSSSTATNLHTRRVPPRRHHRRSRPQRSRNDWDDVFRRKIPMDAPTPTRTSLTFGVQFHENCSSNFDHPLAP
jgi:hypothetical protein